MGCYLCSGTGVTRYGAGYDSETIACPRCNGYGGTPRTPSRSPDYAALECLREKGGTIEYAPQRDVYVVSIPPHGTFCGHTPREAVRKALEAK